METKEHYLIIPLSKKWVKKFSDSIFDGFILTEESYEEFSRVYKFNSRSIYIEKVKVLKSNGYLFCDYHNDYIYLQDFIKTFWVFRNLGFNKKSDYVNHVEIRRNINKLIRNSSLNKNKNV